MKPGLRITSLRRPHRKDGLGQLDLVALNSGFHQLSGQLRVSGAYRVCTVYRVSRVYRVYGVYGFVGLDVRISLLENRMASNGYHKGLLTVY